jgi:hypothetical protein
MGKIWKVTKIGENRTFARALKENVYNSFGKGNAWSLSLNFGLSSGLNCDNSCRHHKQSTADNPTYACYSSTIERQRAAVRENLQTKEDIGAIQVIATAIMQWGELQSLIRAEGIGNVQWMRISSGGSVPSESQIPQRYIKRYKALWRQLVSLWLSVGCKIHFPVETLEKAEFYRSFLGDLITIRVSAQSCEAFNNVNVESSCVVGENITVKTSKRVKRDRIDLARQYARERYAATGRKAIVCPAIVSTFEKRPTKIHCGDCDACSRSGIDVIYPLHV